MKPWLKTVLINIFVTLSLVGMVAFAGEFYLRYVFDQPDYLNGSLVSRRWTKRHIEDKGELTAPLDGISLVVGKTVQLRETKNFTAPKQPGVKRIAVIGDSLAFGAGISNINDRFSNLLELRLNQAGIKAEVYNFGLLGATLAHHRNLAGLVAKQGEFDWLVWQYYFNDNNLSVTPFLAKFKERNLRLMKNPLLDNLFKHSFVFDFLYNRWSLRNNKDWKEEIEFNLNLYQDEKAWGEARGLIRDTAAILARSRIKAVAAIFPVIPLLGEGYPAWVHQQVIREFSAAGIPVIDMLPAFSAYSADQLVVNGFDAHPNELGHQLAAEAIDKFIWESWYQ